jgi:hypothetical protein
MDAYKRNSRIRGSSVWLRYKQTVQDEIKAKKFLKTKVFRLAAQKQLTHLTALQRAEAAKACLLKGASATQDELTAIAQAKLAYVEQVLALCSKYGCKVFATILLDKPERNELTDSYLRRDYIYLFERFFYFLEDSETKQQGLVVFDELDKPGSFTIITQMDRYFKNTAKGIQRASLVIPEPFFVHSDLTTGIQIADLIAYIISWGLRLKEMEKANRPELSRLVQLVKRMCYVTERVFDSKRQKTSSITVVQNKKGNAGFPVKASDAFSRKHLIESFNPTKKDELKLSLPTPYATNHLPPRPQRRGVSGPPQA